MRAQQCLPLHAAAAEAARAAPPRTSFHARRFWGGALALGFAAAGVALWINRRLYEASVQPCINASRGSRVRDATRAAAAPHARTTLAPCCMRQVTVSSMEPEFQQAAKKIGPVAERTNAPPVFL